MSEIKFDHPTNGHSAVLRGIATGLKYPLQPLINAHLGPPLKIRFLASEYSTGNAHQQGHT